LLPVALTSLLLFYQTGGGLSKLVAIGTAVPGYRHDQQAILEFMQRVYAPGEADKRKMKFLYRQGGIATRYSVLPDYSLPADKWQFFPASENLEPFPGIEQRLDMFRKEAPGLSLKAIHNCISNTDIQKITHLITVSCTGFSAPGLDWEIAEQLGLSNKVSRTAINFMGCYAGIHALKIADAFCKADTSARVLVVCTELCSLHFQKASKLDYITSSMLFGDGAAAMLVSGNNAEDGITIDNFYSVVASKGKSDMAWEVSSNGFVMTLSSYVPDLVEENFNSLVKEALKAADLKLEDIDDWCIHPGGKKILEAVHKSLGFSNGQLDDSYEILRDYGNMSSPTVLFVLEKIFRRRKAGRKIFGAAFGPGLTMETFIFSA
jgi:predicted naringenin-chalcone synthase